MKFHFYTVHAFERGLKFFDMADTYGSHTYVREILKEVPLEETTLLTKIWTTDTSWYKTEPVGKTLDRFRLETGSDYFEFISANETDGSMPVRMFFPVKDIGKEGNILQNQNIFKNYWIE